MSMPEKDKAVARVYGGETPELRQARRRAAFIAAGSELMGTVGYRKTTMRALCKAAGLTDRYFYESFAAMEDLLEAVYDERILQMQSTVLTAMARVEDKNDLDTLMNVALTAFFSYVEDPVTARVVWLEVLGVSGRIDQRYEASLQFFASYLQRLMADSGAVWTRDEVVAALVVRALVSAISGTAMSWLLSGYREPKAQVVTAVKVLFNGVLLQAQASAKTVLS